MSTRKKMREFRTPGAEIWLFKKKNMDRSIDLAVQLMDKKKNKMWTNNNKLWTNNNKLWIRNNNKLWIRNYNKLWTNPSADNCVQLLIFFFSLLQQCRSLLLSFTLIAKYAILANFVENLCSFEGKNFLA